MKSVLFTRKKAIKRMICAALLASIMIFSSLASGCVLFNLDSANWVLNLVEQYYYMADGNYDSLGDMSGLTAREIADKLDIYSEYYTAAEYAAVTASNEGSRSGVGISYLLNPEAPFEGITLYTVVGNSPAKRAGLKSGDVLVAGISGGVTTEFTSDDAFTAFMDARKDNENFTFVLADGRQVELAKQDYTASYAAMYTADKTYDVEYDASNAMKIVETDGGIDALPEATAYVTLSQFFGNAEAELGELFDIFAEEGCTSMILDLRSNGGGYAECMAWIGGRFTSALSQDRYVSMIEVYKDGSTNTSYCTQFTDNKGIVPAGTSVYVMADSGTASASEALIGVLVSYDILKYENIFLSKIGDNEARSYGKGIMQGTFENRFTGEALKLTIAGIFWPNGTTIHGVGLTTADGCVAVPSDGIPVPGDEELPVVIEKILSDRA